ncbi:MAG: nucleotidyltransferase domain-containing protein [Magnetococcales bacterium]|nr:nucleotidyltransferase domain-containing protein [Magnetococcales bacterium]
MDDETPLDPRRDGLPPEEWSTYRFLGRLQTLPWVEAIYLFGSRATRTHRARSDIDLAIFCPDANEQEWRQILEIVEEADTLLGIDCVRLDAEPPQSPLRRNIEKNRRLLYERGR